MQQEKALEALKELGELGDNIFPEVQKHDFLPVHKTPEHLCFLYRYEKVVTAASDTKEIENFCVAKKNVVDNILFEPMPRYSVNVSLKFYTETKTLAMVKLTAAEVAEECYKICVENKQTLPGAEVLEKCMVAAKRYKCDHSAQGFKELTTNTELLDDPVDHPASHRYWQRNTLRWTATSPASSPASSHLLFLELRQVLVSWNLFI